MWLRRRLLTAERGRDQLDRKLRILIPEQERLRILRHRCDRDWGDACARARTWLLRAALLGGQDAIRHACPASPVQIGLTWASAMGLRYPAHATLREESLADAVQPPANAAVTAAVQAHRDALQAAVRVAAAQEALRRVDAEIAMTRRRLRALDRRWLPSLREALVGLELALEQAEQEDGVRLRRAAGVPERRLPT